MKPKGLINCVFLELVNRLPKPKFIDNYVRRIYAKLHVNTLGGAVARAIRDGIV